MSESEIDREKGRDRKNEELQTVKKESRHAGRQTNRKASR